MFKKLINTILGTSPLTTLGGYALSAVWAWQDIEKNGFQDWKQAVIPFAIAFLGRVQKDSNGVKKEVEKQVAEKQKQGLI